MKMKEKTKKVLTIAGCTIVGLVLVVAIGSQFAKVPKDADTLPSSTAVVSDVNLSIDTDTSAGEKDIVVNSNTDSTEETIDETPAQTDQPEQSIQPEVTKPAEPSEEQKTDSKQKPDGEKVIGTPKAEDHDNVTPSADTKKNENEPQGGETKDDMGAIHCVILLISCMGFVWRRACGSARASWVSPASCRAFLMVWPNEFINSFTVSSPPMLFYSTNIGLGTNLQ